VIQHYRMEPRRWPWVFERKEPPELSTHLIFLHGAQQAVIHVAEGYKVERFEPDVWGRGQFWRLIVRMPNGQLVSYRPRVPRPR
jgi:hypothetical protein